MAAESVAAGGLVGRDEVIGRLYRVVADAVAGRGSLILLTGEPGAGKSAVLTATAEHATVLGAACGQGAGWPGEGAPAYWPWRQALRGVRRSGVTAAAADPVPGSREGDLGDGEPPASARFRRFDAAASRLIELARERPLVVLLDDLHWADEASVSFLAFLAPRLTAAPLAVVGAYRDVGDAPVAALAALAARSTVVPLGGLAAAAVRRIVADVLGPDQAEDVAADVVRRSGGNPFFVHQLCWVIAAGGTAGEVPPGVRGALELRFAAMDDDARRSTPLRSDGDTVAAGVQALHEVLGAAAALGPGFDPALLEAVTQQPGDAVRRALQLARRHRILMVADPVGGTGGTAGLRFAHDLLLEYAAELLPADRRAAVHAAATDVLLGRRAGGVDVPAARIAAHAVRADPRGEPARSASVEAAREAAATLAYEDAVRHWATAVAAARGPARHRLLLELAAARRRAGDGEGARRDAVRAVAAARAAGDADLLAGAALELQALGTRTWWPAEEIVAILEEALAALGPQPSGDALLVRARLLGALGRTLVWTGADPARGRDLARAAVDAARCSGDPAAVAEALLARHNAGWAPGTAGERLALAEEILAEGGRFPGRVPSELLLEARLLRAADLLELGDARFRPELEEFVRRAEASGQPRWRHAALVRRAMLALLSGRHDEVESLVATARDLGGRIGEPGAVDAWFDQLWDLRESQGRLGEMLGQVQDLVADQGSAPARAMRASALIALGRRDEAVAEMAPLAAGRAFSDGLADTQVGVLQAASGVELARALGAADVADRLRSLLLPYATDTVVSGAAVSFKGAVAHHLGVLATMLGRFEEARAQLERALAVHERLGATVWAERTRHELTGLSGTGGPDVDRAGAVLRRDGGHWTLSYAGATVHLPHSKGLADLAALLVAPGRAVRAADLMVAGDADVDARPGGDGLGLGADDVLDATARRQLRARLTDLDEEIAEAESWSDPERAARARDERDAILAELVAATGLGGRPRRLGDQSERARKAVSARIRDALARIEREHPALAAHLRATVTTGTWCRYDPPPPVGRRD